MLFTTTWTAPKHYMLFTTSLTFLIHHMLFTTTWTALKHHMLFTTTQTAPKHHMLFTTTWTAVKRQMLFTTKSALKHHPLIQNGRRSKDSADRNGCHPETHIQDSQTHAHSPGLYPLSSDASQSADVRRRPSAMPDKDGACVCVEQEERRPTAQVGHADRNLQQTRLTLLVAADTVEAPDTDGVGAGVFPLADVDHHATVKQVKETGRFLALDNPHLTHRQSTRSDATGIADRRQAKTLTISISKKIEPATGYATHVCWCRKLVDGGRMMRVNEVLISGISSTDVGAYQKDHTTTNHLYP